ncbi:MAG: hypothetical protein COC12_10465 [Rhodobacteraceae bacterium]|nr:MAG: hypothetical protein COC12_10465 [Paracoccaceae bacterium]
MRLDRIGQLSEVMRALFAKEQREISAILERESDLRGKLVQLELQVSQNRDACLNNHQLHAVGAQLLWQGWTTRTHRQLNTELAQVMSEKLMAMGRVRLAFGRQQAVEMMQKAELKASRVRKSRKRDQTLVSP